MSQPASPSPAIPSAAVILLRDRGGGIEVLMQRRRDQASAFAGVVVFPGGKVAAIDAHPDLHAAADLGPPEPFEPARQLAALRGRLVETALARKRRLFVPHGALVGLDTLVEQRHRLAEVTITFKKHPKNLDFAESGIDPAIVKGPTVLYDGPARGIARLFPRNINTMITCALATVGLDKCRAVLVADPSLDKAYAEIEARGHDGSRIATWNEQPATGVSGNDMLASIIGSVRAAVGRPPGLAFV